MRRLAPSAWCRHSKCARNLVPAVATCMRTPQAPHLLDQAAHLAHDAVQLHWAQCPKHAVCRVLDWAGSGWATQHAGHGCCRRGCSSGADRLQGHVAFVFACAHGVYACLGWQVLMLRMRGRAIVFCQGGKGVRACIHASACGSRHLCVFSQHNSAHQR